MRRGLLCLLLLPAAVAQPLADPWSGLRANSPAGIEVSLRLLRGGSYRQGELIRAEVHYPGQQFPTAQRPAEELWTPNGFLLDPPGKCGTVAAPCFQISVTGGGIVGGIYHDSPFISLNGYLPPLAPGKYRVAALARKQVLRSRGAMGSGYGWADPPVFTVSNAIEVEIVAASPEWIARTIAASVETLKGPEPKRNEEHEARRAAADQLRFIDTPAAWRAALEILPAEEGTLVQGLAASSQPARVCELMQSAVAAPAQAVSPYYLDNMSRVCATAHLPAPPPGGQPEPTPEQTRYWKGWNDYRQSVIAKASVALAASLPAKTLDKKAVAFESLIQRVEQAQPRPEWVPALVREFINSYPALEAYRQRQLLSQYATALRSRELIPLLESVMDTWKPGDYYEKPQGALASLYALDAARAQARIVAELKKERTWLGVSQLALLPPAAARLTDDELIASLARAQLPGGWNQQLSMTALARYASPKALPRVKAIYESQRQSCQPELIAYFVRVDPAYADGIFHSHAWDMHAQPPRCMTEIFDRTPPIAMGPSLEKYLTAYLMDGAVYVKKAAARTLGRYGSPDALAPLWGAFRYFHDYWKGKAEELSRNGEGEGLEVELRNAIARGRTWLATETDLRLLESLCVSQRCVAETRQDLAAWQKPPRIQMYPQGGGAIAQYYALETLEDLTAKLGQFPKGTQFEVMAAAGVSEAEEELRKRGVALGLTLVPRVGN